MEKLLEFIKAAQGEVNATYLGANIIVNFDENIDNVVGKEDKIMMVFESGHNLIIRNSDIISPIEDSNGYEIQYKNGDSVLITN